MAFAAEMWIEAFENTLFIGLGGRERFQKVVFSQKDHLQCRSAESVAQRR